MVLQLLLDREIVEFPAQRELLIHFFLADAEVSDVEESYMLCCVCELFGKLFFTTRLVELAEIQRHKLSPVDCRMF